MKYDITLQSGSETRQRQVELRPSSATRDGGRRLEVVVDGQAQEVDVVEISPRLYSLLLGGKSYDVRLEAQRAESPAEGRQFSARVAGHLYQLTVLDPRRRHVAAAGPHAGPQEIAAPMPGRIVKVLVEAGQKVEAGQGLLVIEAMKMQNELRAPRPGRVERVFVQEGLGVETGSRLLRIS